MRILRKRGNIWVWGAVGLIAGPWAVSAAKRIAGSVGGSVPTVGNGG